LAFCSNSSAADVSFDLFKVLNLEIGCCVYFTIPLHIRKEEKSHWDGYPFKMTSAARPTFLPAVGGHSLRDTRAGPISYQSAKDLAAHTKLKYRQNGQAAPEELSREELKLKLKEKEIMYMQKVNSRGILFLILAHLEKPNLDEFKEIANLDRDDTDSEDQDEDSDEDEDDTAELMKELEKIKQERLQEQERIEQEKLEEEQKELQERALTGNPLLNDFDVASTSSTFAIKRRWDDDVIFKNQARTEEEPRKRFINDMLRSDFHRKFMNKYVR
jgi:protein CWC15